VRIIGSWAVTEPVTYSLTTLHYTQINGDRFTDYLVIYNGATGSTTNTNIYGYEIIVSADGIAQILFAGENSTRKISLPIAFSGKILTLK